MVDGSRRLGRLSRGRGHDVVGVGLDEVGDLFGSPHLCGVALPVRHDSFGVRHHTLKGIAPLGEPAPDRDRCAGDVEPVLAPMEAYDPKAPRQAGP